MHRLFVGLRPPATVRERLLGLMSGVAGARWQDDDQLHITLRYIGEVDTRIAEDIAAALAGVCAPPVVAALAGVGTFDARGRINAIWAGLVPRAALAALHRKIDAAIVRAGLPPEKRAYLPHITLARLSTGSGTVEGFLASHASLSSEPFTLDHMLLYESHLGRERASYDAVARFALT